MLVSPTDETGVDGESSHQCAAASRVLIQESIATRFIQAIKEVFERARDGMGSSPLELSTQHGPVVDKSQFDRIMGYIEKGKQSAELVTGGKRKGSKGCFIEPTLFVNPTSDSPIWKEEIFGPVLTVKTFKTEKEAIELANDTVYGLACKEALINLIDCGTNTFPFFYSVSVHIRSLSSIACILGT